MIEVLEYRDAPLFFGQISKGDVRSFNVSIMKRKSPDQGDARGFLLLEAGGADLSLCIFSRVPLNVFLRIRGDIERENAKKILA